MTSEDYKATPEQWSLVQHQSERMWPAESCILELRARVQALEEAQRPRVFTADEVAPVATDDALVRRYAQAIETAIKAGEDVDLVGYPARRAIYNLGRQHGAAQARAEQPATPHVRYPHCPTTIAECGGPCEQGPEHCDCGEIKADSEYTDAEWAEIQRWNKTDDTSPPPAPAGSLVERVAKVVGKDRKYSRAAIHEVAAWLDGQMETGAAHILSEEAGRG
jgi:hypothetical protein